MAKKKQFIKYEAGDFFDGKEIKEAHISGNSWILFFVDGTRTTING